MRLISTISSITPTSIGDRPAVGLVQQEQEGIEHESSGHGDHLALTTAEMASTQLEASRAGRGRGRTFRPFSHASCHDEGRHHV